MQLKRFFASILVALVFEIVGHSRYAYCQSQGESTNTPISYDRIVDGLAKDRETSSESYHTLEMAGKSAFPALLRRIDDTTLVDESSHFGIEGEGRYTVGFICRRILKKQIDGSWPKGFSYGVLNDQNLSDWLNKHQNLSLYQMQIRALAESMTSLSQEIESKGMNEYRLAALHVLQRRLGNIIKSAEATQKSLEKH